MFPGAGSSERGLPERRSWGLLWGRGAASTGAARFKQLPLVSLRSLRAQVVGGAHQPRLPPAADAAAGGARRDAILRLPGGAGALRQVPPVQDADHLQLPGVPGAHGGHGPRAAAAPAQGGGAEAEESSDQGGAGLAREIRGGLQAAFPGVPLPKEEQEGTRRFYSALCC